MSNTLSKLKSMFNSCPDMHYQFVEKTSHVTNWTKVLEEGKLEFIEDMNTIWILKGDTLWQLIEHYIIKKLDKYYDEN